MLRFIAIGVVLLGLGLGWRPVQLNGDFTTSYLTWQGWRQGGPFHSAPEVDSADIARDDHRFLSWWSPGTYLGPAALESAGLKLGTAIGLWLVVTTITGFAGWQRLLLQFGFSDRVAGWSLLVMALGWHTLYPFRIYHGGEAALFALFPWLVLAVITLAPGTWLNFPAMAAITLAGTMMKLSFLITALALTGVLAWRAAAGRGSWLQAAVRALPALAGFALGAALIQWLILSRGTTPGTAGLAPAWEQRGWTESAGLALGLPARALVSLTSLAPKFDQVFGWPEPAARTGWLFVAVGLAVALYRFAWRASPTGSYRPTLLMVAAFTTASLGWLYFRQAAISDEDRHARLVALLLLPGIVAAAQTGAWWRRGPLVALLVVAAGWGVLSLAHHWAGGVQRRAVGARNVAYWDLNQDDLAALHAVDAALPEKSVLWLTSIDELALEFPHRRVRPAARLLQAAPDAGHWRGRVDHLAILVADGNEAATVVAALPLFVDCNPRLWRKLAAGRHQLFYYGSASLPLPGLQP